MKYHLYLKDAMEIAASIVEAEKPKCSTCGKLLALYPVAPQVGDEIIVVEGWCHTPGHNLYRFRVSLDEVEEVWKATVIQNLNGEEKP